MTELFQSLITIVLLIVILGGLVLIHELGHFVTARWAKVRVLEFGIGFPPRARILGRGKRPAYDAGRPPRPDPALPPGVDDLVALDSEVRAAFATGTVGGIA